MDNFVWGNDQTELFSIPHVHENQLFLALLTSKPGAVQLGAIFANK